MKPLILLFLVLIPLTRSWSGTYKDFLSYYWTVDGMRAPTCELVRFRLQEWARRESEADQILEWYSPMAESREQRSALLELLWRMPFFNDDRLYEYLIVTHEWPVDIVDSEKLRQAENVKTTYLSSEHKWEDPFKGLFPVDISIEIKPGRIVLKQRLSFQRYCLDDPEIRITFQAQNFELSLIGENNPDLMDEKF